MFAGLPAGSILSGSAPARERNTSMSDFDRNYAVSRGYGADRAAIDQGLRAHMIRVYNYMAIGVAITGVAAWLTFQAAGGEAIHITARGIVGATPFGALVFNPIAQIALFFVTLGMVWYLSARISTMQVGTAFVMFMGYAGLLGLFLAPIFVVYTGASITRVFFISSASFGALSLWGYTTQRDLTAFGAFLMMGLFGLMLAILVNIGLSFFGIHSTMFDFVISIAGVLIFAGLTAYDTQKIK
jgi:hypothetical protein